MAKSRVQLRIDEADLIEIDRRAASVDLNRSDFIRQCALTDNSPSQLALTHETLGELNAWRKELKSIINSLNTILHSPCQRSQSYDQNLYETVEYVNALIIKLDSVINKELRGEQAQ